MSKTEVAIRRVRPKTAKVHRAQVFTDGRIGDVARCGQVVPSYARKVMPVAQTAEEDRCTRCWPDLRG